jgi:cytochrome c peroxidase
MAYSAETAPLPRQLQQRLADNTPATNLVTDAGATLGRVLFYDKRLSANNTTSCSSCHLQQIGFADTARFSTGFEGKKTKRHSMALVNTRFFSSGRFFWDERAASLEEQVLMPIQDSIEMGMTLEALVPKLQKTQFYPKLFKAAFDTSEITPKLVAFALAQFIRSMVSLEGAPSPANGSAEFTRVRPDPQGVLLFSLRCAVCHSPGTHALDGPHNTGLDSVVTDPGAGDGRFKAPSLRNIAIRPPYMHDGRFNTLREVVEFYNSGVQPNPNLDMRLRDRDRGPLRMNLSPAQIDALLSYLATFTDSTLLTAARFSDPFPASSVPRSRRNR